MPINNYNQIVQVEMHNIPQPHPISVEILQNSK